MKYTLSILICIFCLSAFAQTHFSGIQISANLPSGWKIVQEDYGLILLGHNSTPGVIIIAEHGSNSDQAILQYMAEGIQDEGVMLAPENTPQKLSDGTYSVMLTGFADGQFVKAPLRVSKSKTWNSGGITVAALVKKSLYNANYDKMVNTIINSVRYKPFAGNAKAKEWKTYMNNSKLQNRSSYNTTTSGLETYVGAGGSNSTTIHFCSSGEFLAEDYSSSYYGGTGVGGDVSSNTTEYSGKWAVLSIQNQIVIRIAYKDGEIEYYPVKHEGGYIISNGTKFTKDDSNICR